MSEALEKVASLDRLPVFPLPLVLLPGEVLPLHIFEPRFRQMLVDVEASDHLFGVSLFEPDTALTERPEVGSVGCVAEVREAQTMSDGRSNILTFGLIRYRVVGIEDDEKPYLIARVEFFEDEPEPAGPLSEAADEIFGLFQRVAKAAFDLSGNRGKLPEIQKTDPERLSFVVAAAFNLENPAKYELISMTRTGERLERLRTVLSKAVGSMEESAAIHKAARGNGHSTKKIDL